MIVLLIVLACIVAYLAVGFVYVAPRWVAREVEKYYERYPGLAKDPRKVAKWRRDMAGLAWGAALVWPFHSAARTLNDWIARATPLTSEELKAMNTQQAKRIAELERELGIGARKGTTP